MADISFVCSATIRESNEVDVQFSVPYGLADKDTTAEAYKLAYRDLLGNAYVVPVHTDKFYGTAYNPYLDQTHKGVARIADSNQMDVKLSLIQPPVITLVANATKDTYIRQAKPTVNYGSSQTLVAGTAADGKYYTFISIDLASIKDLLSTDMNITALQFKIGKQYSTNGTIDIYECYTNWNENYLMWINSVSLSDKPVLSQYISGSEVTIDCKDYIESLISSGSTVLNIVIKSSDFILFNSKESGDCPRIEVRYTDPSWTGYTDESRFLSTATIKSTYYKNLYNSYRLREKSYQYGRAIKRDPTVNESYVWKNRPFMTCSADTVVSNYFTANAFIKASSDQVASASSNTLMGNSKAEIPARRELYGIAIIPPDQGNDEWFAKASVLRYNWIAYAEKVYSSYMHNSAIIRKGADSDLNGNIRINPETKCKATLRIGKDIVSSVIVRSSLGEDVNANAHIDKPWLNSNYNLRVSNNMVASVFKKAYVNSNISCSAEIQNASIPARYELRVNNNLTSTAELVTANWSNGSAVVRCSANSDVASGSTFRRSDGTEVAGTAIVTNTYYGLNGSVIVRRSATKDVVAAAIKRRTGNMGLVTEAELHRFTNRFDSAELYQNKSVVSSAILRQFDVNHSEWQAFVRGGFYRSPKVSYAEIAVKATYCVGYATVRTSARWWRPNVEGQLTFTDRKLPRQWIRSNFIK